MIFERASQAWTHPIDYNEDLGGRLNICGLDVADYGGHWYGFIDEVRISNEALPPERFLRVCEPSGLAASDADTAIYLPFNSLDAVNDRFFLNNACSTNAHLIDMQVSTIEAGLLPRLDTGEAAVVSNALHAGIFAADTMVNDGFWTFTNNQMVVGGTIQTGKSRSIIIDDFSQNNGVHLISSGDFTAEFYLKLMEWPAVTTRFLCENSGSKTTGTLDFKIDGTAVKCTMISPEELAKYDSGETGSAKSVTISAPVDGIVDGAWHHVALVMDRTHRQARLYLDGNLVDSADDFVLASSVSTYSDGYKKLKIGHEWFGHRLGLCCADVQQHHGGGERRRTHLVHRLQNRRRRPLRRGGQRHRQR